MNATVGYVRVSTEDQKLSPEVQERAIRDYCQLYAVGDPVVRHEEPASGKNLGNRPVMRALLADIEAGQVRAVVCYKLDRLFRSARDAFAFFDLMEDHDVVLHSVQEKLDTSTASGRLVRGILLLLAQWECEQTSERTSAALQRKKAAAGGRSINGRAPYGWEWHHGMLRAVPAEMKVVDKIKALHAEGLATAAITARLNTIGIKPRSGPLWHRTQVRRILER